MTLLELQKEANRFVLGLPSLTEILEGSAFKKFFLYKESIHHKFLTYFTNTFPVTAQHLESEFHHVVRGFLKDHPPSSGILNEYGKSFPAHIKSLQSIENRDDLAEVAEFEWQNHLIRESHVDFGSATPLSMNDLAESLQQGAFPDFRLSLGAKLLEFQNPISTYFSDDEEKSHVLLLRGPDYLDSLWLTPDYYSVYKTIESGENIENAINQALLVNEDFNTQEFFVYSFKNNIFTTKQ